VISVEDIVKDRYGPRHAVLGKRIISTFKLIQRLVLDRAGGEDILQAELVDVDSDGPCQQRRRLAKPFELHQGLRLRHKGAPEFLPMVAGQLLIILGRFAEKPGRVGIMPLQICNRAMRLDDERIEIRRIWRPMFV